MSSRPPLNRSTVAISSATISGFDPTQTLQACVPGQASMKNQNIYTARITQGLVVGALANARPLSPSIQRSFPVYAQNNGTGTLTYRLTIANQPVGGDASFSQFQAATSLDVSVPARSTVARTVFVRSSEQQRTRANAEPCHSCHVSLGDDAPLSQVDREGHTTLWGALNRFRLRGASCVWGA